MCISLLNYLDIKRLLNSRTASKDIPCHMKSLGISYKTHNRLSTVAGIIMKQHPLPQRDGVLCFAFGNAYRYGNSPG